MRGGRRRREAVRQHVEELQEALAARRAEPRREIRNRMAGQVARERVEDARCRFCAASRPATQTIARPPRGRSQPDAVDQPDGVRRLVLSVAVDDEDEVAGRVRECRSSPTAPLPLLYG